ncbi:PQ-loop domain-containing transporter [Spiroplasma endosymbiont of Stenodema calcarata]|uniref:PQ-loop domain-containing transporter n=1 Tax=Spiroplasma endosymbiont of Stenodema calcarata TaxID=3139328 RepID=UPI003CCB0D90
MKIEIHYIIGWLSTILSVSYLIPQSLKTIIKKDTTSISIINVNFIFNWKY